jgi:adenine-specific DNA-methyltransferase
LDLLRPGGLHAFIATNNWITNSGASNLRAKIIGEAALREFIDFGDFRVFDTAGIQTMIYLVEKTGKKHFGETKYMRILRADASVSEVVDLLFKGRIGQIGIAFNATISATNPGEVFTFVKPEESLLLSRLQAIGVYRLMPESVGTGIDVHQDFVNAKHLAVLRNRAVRKGDGIFVISDREKRQLGLNAKEKQLLKPYYTAAELGPYHGNPHNTLWIIYTNPEAVSRMSEYPHIKAHFDLFAPVITSDNGPYGLHRAREEKFFLGEKIVSLRKTDRPHFTWTDFPCYVSQSFFVIKPDDVNLKYLTGILNSRVCHFWLDKKGKKQGNALQVDKAPLLEVPIRPIKFSDPADKARHDKMVALVDRMLDLSARLAKARSVEARGRLQRLIDRTDREIDALVYELYGLTEEEVGIVEEGTG